MNTTPAPAASNPHAAARALLKEFQEKIPVFRDCKPLAIGIDKQILARFPETDRKLLRLALRMQTNSLRYLKAMEKAQSRFDLEGNAVEEVTDAHRAHASELLKERFRKEAEQRKAQREAEAAASRHQQKLDQLVAKFSSRDKK